MEQINEEKKELIKNEVLLARKNEVIVNEEVTAKDEENIPNPVSKQNTYVNDERSHDKTQGLSSKNKRSEPVSTENVVEINETPYGYVYAVGCLFPVFPSESERKEFERVAAHLSLQTTSTVLPFYEVLSKPENFYLAKSLCWIFEIGGIKTYAVAPRDSTQLKTFISIIKQPQETSHRYDTIVGKLDPVAASPEICNCRTLPIVHCNRLETFSIHSFTQYIEKESGLQLVAAKSLFRNMLLLTDNNGSSDAHRAINFITFAYIDLYRILGKKLSPKPTEQIFSFNAVTAKPTGGGGGRKKIEVVFKFEDPATTKEENLHCEVDVTDQYPFITVNLISGNSEN